MKFSPENLELARKKNRYTKVALAEAVGVDVRTITEWLSGETIPSDNNLRQLVRVSGFPEQFFFSPPADEILPEAVSFRALSKLTARMRDSALANATLGLRFSYWLDDQFELPELDLPEIRDTDSPEDASLALRHHWGLGLQPISNMIHLLESRGVRVFSLALEAREVDAFCTWSNARPHIFLNTGKSAVRRRFDAAHELGHLILHKHGCSQGREVEREADAFASSFLMPEQGILPTVPRNIDVNSAIDRKRKWGVSVAAYVFRLKQIGAISDWQYRSLFKSISARGYRTSEPHDCQPEVSSLIASVFRNLRAEGITFADVASELYINERDLAELCFGLTLVGFDGNGTNQNSSKRPDISLAVDNTK